MYQLIIIVHVLLGLSVVGLILMQQGKGADAGAAFAGGGSGSVFGAQGAASFLSRATAILAALFFITSLGLAVLSGYENKPDDLMEQPEIEQPLEDVPLIGENKPSAESIPVIQPTESVPVILEPIDEATTETIINKPQQVNDNIVPVTNANETLQVETATISDESIPVIDNDIAIETTIEEVEVVPAVIETPVDQVTETVTQP